MGVIELAEVRMIKEKMTLWKYLKTRPVEPEDLAVLRDYEFVGLVHFDFSLTKKKMFARLTKDGGRTFGLGLVDL